MIFNSEQKIAFVEEIAEELFIPIDFNSIIEKHFDNITGPDDYRKINGKDFSINYGVDEKPTGCMMFNLYGENALFELIRISKIYGWQIFDTGNGQMIDLDHPEINGYEDFQKYLQHVLSNAPDKSEK